jgi:DNA-binding NtrC family response regulator
MNEIVKDKILMIDDEPDIIHSFEATFKNFKHLEFFTALCAEEGIEIARRENPRVILLDLRMPGMSGEEALLELKKICPASKLIVMTGWDDGETQMEIEQMGVTAFYPKPVDFEKIVTKILNLIMIKN